MCGICGFYGFRNDKLLKRMSKAIAHRGPDGFGYYSHNAVSLAHRRLSIIDLKTGQQPMFNEDKTIAIVYNGEIYNYKELRINLIKKGHKFSTSSDTEVIIHSYEEYGKDCVKLFNGMFAFALWDKKKSELFIARDRMGIKPLYYSYQDGEFVFASEIKSILQHSKIKKEPYYPAVIDYLAFQNILNEKTFFKGINLLLPAQTITVNKDGVKMASFWEPDFEIQILKNHNDYTKKFKEVFSRSVERHMISDVPVGSYLSGGFDSSSVATIASEKSGKRIETFTGRFKEGGIYDESECSRAVAKKINARIHEVTITPQNFLESIAKVIYHMDEPRMALPAFSQYWVSNLVSKHVKVVLTGHGGDELFAGYPIYKVAYFKEMIRKNKLNIIKALRIFKLSEVFRAGYFLFFPLISKEVSSGLFIMFDEKERKKLFRKDFLNSIKHSPQDTLKGILHGKRLHESEKITWLYVKTYLHSLFIVEDKMGMANSIEARIPLCDNELVDFALSVPIEEKLYNNELKYIIKSSMKDKLPAILYSQPKLGFPTPLSIWFRRDLKDFAYSLLLSDRCTQRRIFNEEYIKNLLDKHCSSKTDGLMDLVNANRIWSLINIELWFRIFIEGDKNPAKV